MSFIEAKTPLPGPVIRPTMIIERPSSAAANIQSHPNFNSGLLDKKSMHKTEIDLKLLKNQRPITQIARVNTEKIFDPKEEILRRPRRQTLDTTADPVQIRRLMNEERNLQKRDEKIEDVEISFDIATLEDLKKAFDDAMYDRHGKLTLREFIEALRNNLNMNKSITQAFEKLFTKIDWINQGTIDWNDLCSYMQLEYEDKEEIYQKAREMTFSLPAKVENTPHREGVMRITSLSDGNFIAGSTDGTLSFWTSQLELKKIKSIVTAEQMLNRKKSKWVTDFLIMTEFNKIIAATGDREIEFFELSSFEPYCRIYGLETVPLCLDYSVNKENNDRSLIMWGDRNGCLNILKLNSTGECLRTWKKGPRSEGIACIGMENVLTHPTVQFTRWIVHRDWVLDLKYYESLGQVISCSNDEKTAVVIGSISGSTSIKETALPSQQHQHQQQQQTQAPSQSLQSVSEQFPQLLEQANTVTVASASNMPQNSVNSHSSMSTSLVQLPPVSANATTIITGGAGISAGGGIQRPPQTAPSSAKPMGSLAMLAQMVQSKRRMNTDQTVFRIYKGCRTFDFCKSRNILVTGGLDRIIRMWNPYVNSKPTGMLKGHSKPIVYLHIAEQESRIFSISVDKCIKVWDIHDQNCLLTIRPKGHRIRGPLQAAHFSTVSKSLMVATDQMAMLNVKTNPYTAEQQWWSKHADSQYIGGYFFDQVQQNTSAFGQKPPVLHTDIVLTHKEAVTGCIFNPLFNQVITSSENSDVKVWDLLTGSLVYQFDEAHRDYAITCLGFDSNYRRLITGGRDGVVKLWNFNNGQCLRELRKSEENSLEIAALEYVEISKNRFIISVGWDRCINMFVDSMEDTIHLVHEPQPAWPDDLNGRGHQEDILSLTTSGSNLLATSDYSGTIIVWNMISGHVFTRIPPPPPIRAGCPITARATSTNKNSSQAHNHSPFHLQSRHSSRPITSHSAATNITSSTITTTTINGSKERDGCDDANEKRQSGEATGDDDLSIRKLIFLRDRCEAKMGAILIASGPHGHIHFWSIYNGGELYSRFKGGQEKGQTITTMITAAFPDEPVLPNKTSSHPAGGISQSQYDRSPSADFLLNEGASAGASPPSTYVADTTLITGDKFGFISVWNIQDYALHHVEQNCPELKSRWRAHTGIINQIDVSRSACVLISCSNDATVRLWNLGGGGGAASCGQFVGTFGQPYAWDLRDPASFQHPMVPYDVLIHPQSLPDHPVCGPRLTVEQRREQNKREQLLLQQQASQRSRAAPSITSNAAATGETPPTSSTTTSGAMTGGVIIMDDKAIQDELNAQAFRQGRGKRLRHERMKPNRIVSSMQLAGVSNEFHMLHCFDLNPTPSVKDVDNARNKKSSAVLMQ